MKKGSTSCEESTLEAQHRIYGCLLGTAVGDSIGLPLENLSKSRVNAWIGKSSLKHRFLLGHGLVSDDTEHSCLVAQSLVLHTNRPEDFGRDLAWRLKWWLAGLPAGTGKATAKACLRLWLGADHTESGIWSAGNGAAMRAPIIGVAVRDPALAVTLTKISSRITHSDPRAMFGAVAVAALSHCAVTDDCNALAPDNAWRVCQDWIALANEPEHEKVAAELLALIRLAAESAERRESTLEFAQSIGLVNGVSGYTYDTVPVSLHACMRYPNDFETGIEQLIRCGGDVDSTAAIAGGILGASLGEYQIPRSWIEPIVEWPRTLNWMRKLAESLADSARAKSLADPSQDKATMVLPTIRPLGQLLRNLVFLIVVLLHAFRRLLPPY